MKDTHLQSLLSPAEARQIDQTCDRFEAAWKAGQRPSLEEYLDTADEPARSALLRQLLLLDWDYRRRAGDDPRAGDYHTRFPSDPGLIADVGRAMTDSPDSTRVGKDDPHGQHTPWSGAKEVGRIDHPSHAKAGAARYDLLQEVGHGGIGVVFRARDHLLGRELAVKALREDYRDNPEVRRRFTEEARVGSQLQHPAIVPVYGLGWFGDGRPYFTMKLVEGHTLAALLQDRADPGQDLPRWLGIFEQVCQAMAYAHARGVVHRDLKPANVMVGAFGEVQVMDWGFAKKLQMADGRWQIENSATGPESSPSSSAICNSAAVTQSGVLMGTPAYMPPEQARGETALIDPRADVFALGAILCEILTGRPPYVGGTGDEVCRKAAEGDLHDAHARLDACGADEALRELAKRCLAAERPARPPDAGVVASGLTAYLASAQERLRQAQLERAAAEARAQEAGAKAKAERHALRLTLALAAAAVVLLVLAGAGWWWRERVQQAEVLRVAATDSKVEAALAEAGDHLNRNDWSQARAAATRARELLESGASGHWKERIDEMLADLDLVTQLDEIHMLQTNLDYPEQKFHRYKTLPRFADTFARHGIRAGMPIEQVVARIAHRPAPVHGAMVAGLENWWLLALSRKDAAGDWLGAVLQALDTDEWRTKVRRAVAREDRRALEELAAQDEANRQPPATLNAVAVALISFQAYDAAIAILRPAQRRHPGDFWINFNLALAFSDRQPRDSAQALRFYSNAVALRPAATHYGNLIGMLASQQDWDGVILAARTAIERHAAKASVYHYLGVALERKGEWQQAMAAFQKSLALGPDKALDHFNIGQLFSLRGEYVQAIAAYERAIQLEPGKSEYHYHIGSAHSHRKDYDAALAAYEKAIELKPDFVSAHFDRGNTLVRKGRMDDAIAAFETAVRLDPTKSNAHGNLGQAWVDKGRPDRALPALTRAIDLGSKVATHHYYLGNALGASADLDGRAAAYHKAIELDPKLAEAHWNLGTVFVNQGRFAEGLASMERGHQLGASPVGDTADKGLKQARRLVALDAKLPGILDGSGKPATVSEQLQYAWVCQLKGLCGASARLYAGAFAADPAFATSPGAEHRFRAACVAAMAGSALGRDAAELTDTERARLRKQALGWLRADLALWTDRLDSSPNSRSAVQSALERWRREKALAGIRELEELAKLPEPERADYIRFWADDQELLVRCLASQPGK